MGTISVSVDDNLREKIQQFDEVNWSAVARKAFEEKLREIELLRKLAQKSKITEKDAKELAKNMNMSMARRFREM
ncbi:hypothetical protein HYW21_05910 [Candidatus Woesearchaeota archaeon]|nr:hypothetical protein [Candidatus Woesearchaeota archaeon]